MGECVGERERETIKEIERERDREREIDRERERKRESIKPTCLKSAIRHPLHEINKPRQFPFSGKSSSEISIPRY